MYTQGCQFSQRIINFGTPFLSPHICMSRLWMAILKQIITSVGRSALAPCTTFMSSFMHKSELFIKNMFFLPRLGRLLFFLFASYVALISVNRDPGFCIRKSSSDSMWVVSIVPSCLYREKSFSFVLEVNFLSLFQCQSRSPLYHVLPFPALLKERGK